jgi:hypothetical protein
LTKTSPTTPKKRHQQPEAAVEAKQKNATRT